MDEITKTGMQFVPEDLKKEFKEAAELMEAALTFIDNINKILQKYNHNFSLFSIKNLSQVATAMHEDQNRLRELISAQYDFEAKVNSFLGRSINFAWADNEGNIFFADETSAKKIYEDATINTKNFMGKVNISESKIKANMKNLPIFMEKQLQQGINARMQAHQMLYKEILLRWKQNQNENNPWYKQHKNTVYWQKPPNGIDNFNHKIWAWSDKTNQGYISESYVGFIFNQKTILASPTEFNIGSFMMTFMNEKDQVPGIVKGDIIVRDTKDQVQIAVKSSNFNTASIGPYISVAYQIIEFDGKLQNLTVDNVQNILNNLKRYNQSVVKKGKEKAQDILGKEISSINGISIT